MRRLFICAFLSMIFTAQAIADEKHKVCIADAMDRHLKLSLELFKGDVLTMLSPEKQILQRRTYETYCLEMMACGLQNYKGDNRAMVSSLLFSKCMDDEHNN